ncbi:hypothetical protein [Pantoea ananatis]|nr:hypothetical protein [Pantoea ananatis]
MTAPLFALLLWRHGAGEVVQPLTEEQIMPDWIINNAGHFGG